MKYNLNVTLTTDGYGYGGPLPISPPRVVFTGLDLLVKASQKLGIPFIKDYQLGNYQGRY